MDGDNERVKSALLAFVNTYIGLRGYNALSPFLRYIFLEMPETTITAEIVGAVSPQDIAHEIISVINKAGATPDKVYVAFISEEYLWNAE